MTGRAEDEHVERVSGVLGVHPRFQYVVHRQPLQRNGRIARLAGRSALNFYGPSQANVLIRATIRPKTPNRRRELKLLLGIAHHASASCLIGEISLGGLAS